jgi:flagellar hook-associated protein 1 FlgK
MSSAFSIGLSGLKAAQVGLDVTSHNIANVNTPNFRRQLVDLTQVSYQTSSPSIPSGAGVAVANIRNAGSPLLLKEYSDALSNSSEYDTLSSLSQPLDKLLNNSSYNLSNSMQDTFNAFEDVATNPTSVSIRQNALDKAQNFVEKSQSLMGQLTSFKNNLQATNIGDMDKANTLLTNIAEVNKQISYTGGNQDSSLGSKRDSLLLDLAKITGITVSDDKKSVISSSGKQLIQNGINFHPIVAEDLPRITGGSIGGTNKFINNMLNVAMTKLPGAIQQVATEINKQAVQGYDLNGNIGSQIFNIPNETLSDFKLTISDPRNLGAATTSSGMNDGTNAQKLSDLRTKSFDGQTMQEKYSGIISNLDGRTKNYADMSNIYNDITDDFNKSIQSESGVNLDEEAANLLKYQQMYSASAQVIKTQNEIFGTLINIMA